MIINCKTVERAIENLHKIDSFSITICLMAKYY